MMISILNTRPKITARIQGNGVYNSAAASYELNIDKADPKLDVSHLGVLHAQWADGKNVPTQPNFINSDANNIKPPVNYSIDKKQVSEINANTGLITQVKPGTATITIQSRETEQFKSDSKTVTYNLDKRKFDVTFNKATLEVADNKDNFQFQATKVSLPDKIEYSWKSGSNSVIAINSNNQVTNLAKGESRLTMTIKPNSYFVESSGDYNVEVYSNPIINIKEISYSNNDQVIQNTNEWLPVFTSDHIKVKWQNPSSTKYDKVSKATLLIKENDHILDSVVTTVIHDDNEMTLSPKKEYYGKKIKLQLITEGKEYLDLKETKTLSTVNVKITQGKDINGLSLYTTVHYRNSSNGDRTSSCKNPAAFETDPRHVVLSYNHYLDIGNKKLLSPISVTYKLSYINGSMPNNITYPKTWGTEVADVFSYEDYTKQYAIKNDCYYSSHYGNASLDATIKFMGQTSVMKSQFHWGKR